MNIFSPDPFFNTPFAEIVNYISDGIGYGLPVKAIVSKKQRKPFTYKGSDSQQVMYPYKLMIRREDIEEINLKRDKVIIIDKDGKSKTIVIQEILSSDEGVWNLGAV